MPFCGIRGADALKGFSEVVEHQVEHHDNTSQKNDGADGCSFAALGAFAFALLHAQQAPFADVHPRTILAFGIVLAQYHPPTSFAFFGFGVPVAGLVFELARLAPESFES